MATNGHAVISLYDLNGRKVKDIVNQIFSSGKYSIKLNASDLPSGMYFYTMQTSDSRGNFIYNQTKKMVLMK